MKYCASSRVEE